LLFSIMCRVVVYGFVGRNVVVLHVWPEGFAFVSW
jgi:hypothetical protein